MSVAENYITCRWKPAHLDGCLAFLLNLELSVALKVSKSHVKWLDDAQNEIINQCGKKEKLFLSLDGHTTTSFLYHFETLKHNITNIIGYEPFHDISTYTFLNFRTLVEVDT